MAQRSTAESAGTAATAQVAEKPKVLYIMGAGRSGSTILGVTLGNCEGVFYAGELDKWLLMSGISMHERRGVDPSGESQAPGLWKLVREDVAADPALFGRAVRRCIEHSSSLFRVHKLLARRRLVGPYRRVTGTLYRAVARRAGAEVIVDSSHFPLRARQLQNLAEIELYILFLVRDPQGVVASWERPGLPEPRFSMLATNAYLWLTHLLSLSVFLGQPAERRLFIRYEDFIARPESVLADILRVTGSAAAVPDLSRLSTGSPYHGNRLIFSEVVSLRRDTTSAPGESRVTRLLQLPWSLVLSRLRPAAGAGSTGGS